MRHRVSLVRDLALQPLPYTHQSMPLSAFRAIIYKIRSAALTSYDPTSRTLDAFTTEFLNIAFT